MQVRNFTEDSMVGKICLKEQDKIVVKSNAQISQEPGTKRYRVTVENEPTTFLKIEQKEDRLILMRKNETLRMRYTFQLEKTTKGICQINELAKPIWLTINTTKVIQEPGRIFIEYRLEETPYQFEIKWREL